MQSEAGGSLTVETKNVQQASSKRWEFKPPAFHRLTIEAEKIPPVDPHSLEVLRDGVPRFLAPFRRGGRQAGVSYGGGAINRCGGPCWRVAPSWVAPQRSRCHI